MVGTFLVRNFDSRDKDNIRELDRLKVLAEREVLALG
jgi:hypothetical protein